MGTQECRSRNLVLSPLLGAFSQVAFPYMTCRGWQRAGDAPRRPRGPRRRRLGQLRPGWKQGTGQFPGSQLLPQFTEEDPQAHRAGRALPRGRSASQDTPQSSAPAGEPELHFPGHQGNLRGQKWGPGLPDFPSGVAPRVSPLPSPAPLEAGG